MTKMTPIIVAFMMYSTLIFAEVDQNKLTVLQKHNVEFITLTDEELIAYMAEYDYISVEQKYDNFCDLYSPEDDAFLDDIISDKQETISDVEVSL